MSEGTGQVWVWQGLRCPQTTQSLLPEYRSVLPGPGLVLIAYSQQGVWRLSEGVLLSSEWLSISEHGAGARPV